MNYIEYRAPGTVAGLEQTQWSKIHSFPPLKSKTYASFLPVFLKNFLCRVITVLEGHPSVTLQRGCCTVSFTISNFILRDRCERMCVCVNSNILQFLFFMNSN